MRIDWFSPVWGHAGGYGNAAEHMIRALEARGHEVGITHQETAAFRGECDRGWLRRHPPLRAGVGIYFTLPTTWMAKHSRSVGFSMWETSEIPVEWRPWLDKVDEIWVPSHYCAELFRPHVRRAVHVIPFGVAPQEFPISAPRDARRIRFLHIWSAHGLERKGADLAVGAFRKAFDGRDDVELVLQGGIGAAPASDDARIRYTCDRIGPRALAGYFAGFDALLYTSRAEGFGLMALEAACTGMPVFHSGRTGMSEYANLGTVVPSNARDAGHDRGIWYEIDTDALASAMRRFADDPQPYREKARADAESIRRTFTWDRTAQAIERRLMAS